MNRHHLKLKIFAPLTSLYYRGLIAFNLVLGVALISGLVTTREFFIVNDTFTYQFWGVLFLLVGVGQLVSYLFNSFPFMRVWLITGFTIQMFWVLALAARQIEQLDSNLFLFLFFALIAYFKYCLYIYFPSNREADQWTRD